jgi:uncharacterized membrane protein
MKSRLITLWDTLSTSFWFVPACMALAAAALSVATVELDRVGFGRSVADSVGWVWSGGAEGARSLLSTVASSMITVAGTVFSITIAALTLASSQFGPRLLRNFTRDTGNQLVLGTFVATFLYCLLVLRTVRSQAEGGFVPYLSITAGMVLAIASIGVLIYFIHHVAGSIQAEPLIAAVASELKRDIARLCPPAPPGPGDAVSATASVLPDAPSCPLRSTSSGYLQAIDRDGLLKMADRSGWVIRVLVRPGDFVSRGDVLAQLWSERDEICENRVDQILDAFSFGVQRTPVQDVRYGVQQLVEIAGRALSPGINDPFTAIGCTDWLADALALVARSPAPSGIRCGASGTARLVEDPIEFAELVRLSFEPVRTYGADSVVVLTHLLQAIGRLSAAAGRAQHRALLLDEAEQTAAAARRACRSAPELDRLQATVARVRSRLEEAADADPMVWEASVG